MYINKHKERPLEIHSNNLRQLKRVAGALSTKFMVCIDDHTIKDGMPMIYSNF